MADSAANEDPGRFPELGYCLFRDGLSADVVARYSALVDVLFAENKRGEPHFHSDVWRNLCCHPPILDAVEAVLGAELILFFSSVFMKQPHDNQRVDWHQDNTYWPSVSGTDVVTVWVALDDVDESNSCMNVVPRSHEGYRELEMLDVEDLSGAMLRRKVEVTEQMEADAVPMALAAGQISIHDSFLVHGSSPNRSGRRRAGYTIRYGSALTTKIDLDRHTYGDFSLLPVYYVRGNGSGMSDRYVDARPTPS